MNDLSKTVTAMRPMLPARNFKRSEQFYIEMGFRPIALAPNLVEMKMGAFSFILQDYYVQQWADNFAMHMRVSDVEAWWKHIEALTLADRYGAKVVAPRREDWGLVVIVVDPSGVIWQIAELPESSVEACTRDRLDDAG